MFVYCIKIVYWTVLIKPMRKKPIETTMNKIILRSRLKIIIGSQKYCKLYCFTVIVITSMTTVMTSICVQKCFFYTVIGRICRYMVLWSTVSVQLVSTISRDRSWLIWCIPGQLNGTSSPSSFGFVARFFFPRIFLLVFFQLFLADSFLSINLSLAFTVSRVLKE